MRRCHNFVEIKTTTTLTITGNHCPADYYSDAGKDACKACDDGFVPAALDDGATGGAHTRCDP